MPLCQPNIIVAAILSAIYVVFRIGTVLARVRKNKPEKLNLIIGGHKNDFNEMDKQPGFERNV